MGNNGKSLTNVSFRAKMLEVIDKLKNQNKTALVRHVDDFESLNKDTFEAGMNALIEAIPEGGGGSGDGGYVVTFGVNFDAQEEKDMITCDKTIDDIIAHKNEHIVGRFVVEGLSLGDDSPKLTADLYCDNMKFDYQKLNVDDPEYASLLDNYTYLGFVCDKAVLSLLDDAEAILENEGPEYYKAYIKIVYLFSEETPYWTMLFEDISSDPEYIGSSVLLMPEDQNRGSRGRYKISISRMNDNSSMNFYLDENSGIQRLFTGFYAGDNGSYYDENRQEYRTCLYGQKSQYHTSRQEYMTPAQFDVEIEDTDYTAVPSVVNVYHGIFEVSKYNFVMNGSEIASGMMELTMDEDDSINNKIIRHILHIEDSAPFESQNVNMYYKKIEIPYTQVEKVLHYIN